MQKNEHSPSHSAPDRRKALWNALAEIDGAEDLGGACQALARFSKSAGAHLLLVKIADLVRPDKSVRPWSDFTDDVRVQGQLLQTVGGCVFHRESLARMRPYLFSEILRKDYASLTERRFFVEVEKLGYADIFAIPVVVGRGMALVLIGLENRMSAGEGQGMVDAFTHLIASVLSKFPEVGKLFRERRLTEMEANIVLLRARGQSPASIKAETGLSELGQGMLIERACGKLGARKHFELVRLATLAGELDANRFENEGSEASS